MIARYLVIQRRIERDLADLDRSEQAVVRHWNAGLRAAQDQDVYINSVALNLHSFYSGLERIFEVIATDIDGIKSAAGDWHVALLRQMALDLSPLRPAVLTEETVEQLDELRGFSHWVRNLYAANLDPTQMKRRVEMLPALWVSIRLQLTQFLDFLGAMTRADEV